MPKRLEKQTRSEEIYNVVLYRPELDHILDILNSRAKDIEISDDEFQYESLDDMKGQRGNSISNIRITSKTPRIMIRAWRGWLGRIEIDGDGSPDAKAIVYDIRSIAASRRHPLAFLGESWALAIFMTSQLAFCVLLIAKAIPSSIFISIIVNLFYIIGQVTWHVANHRFLRIYLIRPHERTPGFIARNWERVLIGAVSALITWFLKDAYEWWHQQ